MQDCGCGGGDGFPENDTGNDYDEGDDHDDDDDENGNSNDNYGAGACLRRATRAPKQLRRQSTTQHIRRAPNTQPTHTHTHAHTHQAHRRTAQDCTKPGDANANSKPVLKNNSGE
jgi:hypothetical protein